MSDATKEQPEAVAPAAEAQLIKDEVAPTTTADMTEVETSPENPTAEAKTEDKSEVKPERTKRGNQSKAKSDPSTLNVTDNPSEIRTQVEFYFGDANLPTDKFMWDNTGGAENKPVPLKTICSFKRMRRFQPYSAIVAALKESKVVQVTEVNGQEMVSRKVAYKPDPDGPKKRFAQSVYIKGFGEEQNSTQFDIEAWIAQFGTIDRIKLRREEDGTFKGSVFVEFHTPELAEKFVTLEPAPKFQGKDLVIMAKAAYTEMKLEQIRNGEIQPSKGKPQNYYEGRTGGRGRGRDGHGKAGRENGKHGRDKERNGFRGGRGGRGRGRGGRGRGSYGGRDRDERSNGKPAVPEKSIAPKSVNDVKEPEIKATMEKTNGKRAREEDGGDKVPPTKKVDTKVADATAA